MFFSEVELNGMGHFIHPESLEVLFWFSTLLSFGALLIL